MFVCHSMLLGSVYLLLKRVNQLTEKQHIPPKPSMVENHTESSKFTTSQPITITLSVTFLHCTIRDTTMVMAGISIITVEITTPLHQSGELQVHLAEETLLL